MILALHSVFLTTTFFTILLSLSENIDISRGKGLWKFDNSLCHKPDFATEFKNNFKVICNRMLSGDIKDEQLCWEYIKYEIRKFSIRFSKEYQKTRGDIVTFENKVTELNLEYIFDRNYLEYKNKLEQVYEEKANTVKIRSKCG